MKLVVGLGNPGRAYEGTRHNIGFKVLETIAKRAGSPLRRGRFQGECSSITPRMQFTFAVAADLDELERCQCAGGT